MFVSFPVKQDTFVAERQQKWRGFLGFFFLDDKGVLAALKPLTFKTFQSVIFWNCNLLISAAHIEAILASS